MKNVTEINLYLRNIQNGIVKHMTKMQQDVAKDICKDIKELAPVDTGKYVESINVGETTVNDNVIETPIVTNATVQALNSGKIYNLGYLLEHGTLPHIIRPVNAKVLHFQINGEDIFTMLVHHPGFAEIPHFIPALNNNKDKYISKIGETLDKEFK